MAITDWPVHLRPRERLIQQGAGALSDAELLAIFLRVGVAGQTAVDLARQMIGHFGSLRRLFGASLGQFSAMHGLGPAKFAQLQAVMELTRRALAEGLASGSALSSPQSVRQYLQLHFSGQLHESFVVLFVDVKNCLLATEELFRGTLTHTSVHAREIVRAVLRHNAAAVFFAHNHPSGNAAPSSADRALTGHLVAALALIDVKVLDHFVVGADCVYSFAENGAL